MNCILVEDEFLVRQALRRKLNNMFPELDIVAEMDSLEALEQWLQTNIPDLIFLDINFPDGNSIEFARKNFEKIPYIIFVTSYPQFALDAIRLDAIDYLLKPIQDHQLEKAVRKYYKYAMPGNEETLLGFTKPQGKEPQRLMVPSQAGNHILEISDIIRCMAEVNYTRIFIRGRSPILVAITLKTFAIALKDHGFVRVHKSHIINLSRLDKYQKNTYGGVLTMSDGSVVPLSKAARNEFQDKLQSDVIVLGV